MSEHDDIGAVIALLCELWPKAFAVYERRRRPLVRGIHRAILIELSGVITARELERALGAYTSNLGYQRALAKGGARFDLVGEPYGEVSAAERICAATVVARRLEKPPTEPTAHTANADKPVLRLKFGRGDNHGRSA